MSEMNYEIGQSEIAKRQGLIQAVERVQPQAEMLAGAKREKVTSMAADLKPLILREGQLGAIKYLQSVR